MSYQPQTLRELEELIELYWHDLDVGVRRRDGAYFAKFPSGHEAGPYDTYKEAMRALVAGGEDQKAFERIVGEA